jgi:DNA (cytosine-5)-methyltransferase 1
MSEHRFPYRWNLSDGYPAKGISANGCKVFGTFICGGGSTMGYKLAGFEHLGGVEIDPKVADVYKANHKPKHLFIEDIREFNKRTDLPPELYNLDILDGSPPCSTFSMAGSREKGWGKEKVFREGQALQTLDDLVFVYCDTIAKLKPKVFLLENVKGIIQGNAKWYSKEIVRRMEGHGYKVQVFLLNAASMGVPQKRERVFFIGHKKEFDFPRLVLSFDEKAVVCGEIAKPMDKIPEDLLGTALSKERWSKIKPGQNFGVVANGSSFSHERVDMSSVFNTVDTAAKHKKFHGEQFRKFSKEEYIQFGTYPLDYNFKSIEPDYLIGMSVPPVMTAQIAHQIWLQWLSKQRTNSDAKG